MRRGPPRRPTLYVSRDGPRRATWLELFFDLVFVLAIAELVGFLHRDPTPGGFLRFAFLFVPIWWAWSGFTYYADLFDIDGPAYRLAMLTAMLGSLALALNVRDAFVDGESADFALTYVALRVLLVGLYAWAWRQASETRLLTAWHVVGYSFGAAVWAASLLFPAPARYAFWALGLLVELATPAIIHFRLRRGPLQVSHLPERLGLFTIVVLGESVFVTGTTMADTDYANGAVAVAVAAFAAVGCLWWLYFDQVDEAILERPYAGGLRGLLIAFGWSYGHIVLFAALATFAAGAELAIEEATHDHLVGAARAAFGGGLALSLLTIAGLRLLSPAPPPPRVIAARLAAVAAVLALAAAGDRWPPPVFAGLLAAVVVALTAFETAVPAALEEPVGDAGTADGTSDGR